MIILAWVGLIFLIVFVLAPAVWVMIGIFGIGYVSIVLGALIVVSILVDYITNTAITLDRRKV